MSLPPSLAAGILGSGPCPCRYLHMAIRLGALRRLERVCHPCAVPLYRPANPRLGLPYRPQLLHACCRPVRDAAAQRLGLSSRLHDARRTLCAGCPLGSDVYLVLLARRPVPTTARKRRTGGPAAEQHRVALFALSRRAVIARPRLVSSTLRSEAPALVASRAPVQLRHTGSHLANSPYTRGRGVYRRRKPSRSFFGSSSISFTSPELHDQWSCQSFPIPGIATLCWFDPRSCNHHPTVSSFRKKSRRRLAARLYFCHPDFTGDRH